MLGNGLGSFSTLTDGSSLQFSSSESSPNSSNMNVHVSFITVSKISQWSYSQLCLNAPFAVA